jgi:hypothetical protein
MLADVLSRSRPSRLTILLSVSMVEARGEKDASVGKNSNTMLGNNCPVPVPSEALAPNSCQALSWQQVWQYAVHDLSVGPHIRLALDDDHAGVSSAASGALAALWGSSEADAVENEAADCCPSTGMCESIINVWLTFCPVTVEAGRNGFHSYFPVTHSSSIITGWPCIWNTYLSRPDALGIWEAQHVEANATATPNLPGEDEKTPEDVAAIDPVAGLFQMQVRKKLEWEEPNRKGRDFFRISIGSF